MNASIESEKKVVGCPRGVTVRVAGSTSCPPDRPPLCKGCDICLTHDFNIAGQSYENYLQRVLNNPTN